MLFFNRNIKNQLLRLAPNFWTVGTESWFISKWATGHKIKIWVAECLLPKNQLALIIWSLFLFWSPFSYQNSWFLTYTSSNLFCCLLKNILFVMTNTRKIWFSRYTSYWIILHLASSGYSQPRYLSCLWHFELYLFVLVLSIEFVRLWEL